jgi:hypothetical protein
MVDKCLEQCKHCRLPVEVLIMTWSGIKNGSTLLWQCMHAHTPWLSPRPMLWSVSQTYETITNLVILAPNIGHKCLGTDGLMSVAMKNSSAKRGI